MISRRILISTSSSSSSSSMAGRGNVMVTAALLVLANVLALHMPLVEAQLGNLDQYSYAQLAHWTFDGTLAPEILTVSGTPEAPEPVPLSDGSCCVSYQGFTFCINPPAPRPDSICYNVCGAKVCISRSDGEVNKGTGKFTLLDNCCFCYSGMKVCIRQGEGDASAKCTPICGYTLCFSFCTDDSQPGPALLEGPNVQLVGGSGNGAGYVQIRQPGYLNLPAVHFNDHPAFTVTFSLRIPSYPDSSHVLYCDWSPPHWQFLSSIDAAGKLYVYLWRNMITDGANPDQGLLELDSGDTVVPVTAWFDVAFQFDKNTRTGKLFLDQKLVGSAIVRSSLADADVVLMKSSSAYYQFGRKVDTDNAGRLDADLRQLRIFSIAIA